MATRDYGTAVGTGDRDTKRWLLIAMVALANVLLWTTVLGLTLLQRWSVSTPSVLQSDSRNAATQPVPSADRSRDAQLHAPMATTARSTVEPQSGVESPAGAPHASDAATASLRPKPYSSIDTQTLAAARVREEALAGKRMAVEDAALAVALPAPAQPPPVAPAVRDSSGEAPGQPHHRTDPQKPLRRVTDVRDAQRGTLASAQRPPPSFRLQRIGQAPTVQQPSDKDVHALASRGATTSEQQREGPIADVRAASPGPSRDAVAAQLDDRWERRERLLRERLSR